MTLDPGTLVRGATLDLILAGVAVEAMVLLWWNKRRGGGLSARALLANLAAGAALLGALRAALATPADPRAIALLLVIGLAAHILDIATRWRRA